MTVLIAEHLQITRLWVSAALKNLNSHIIIKEADDLEMFYRSTAKTQADILVTSASFLTQERGVSHDTAGYLMKFPLKIIIKDKSLPDELVSLFDEVIESDENEKSIIDKFDRLTGSLTGRTDKRERNDDISHREKEVLRLVALGLTNKEIANRLFISSHTVITHRKNITAKLGIRTIAGLTLYAVINKLITPEDIQER